MKRNTKKSREILSVRKSGNRNLVHGRTVND